MRYQVEDASRQPIHCVACGAQLGWVRRRVDGLRPICLPCGDEARDEPVTAEEIAYAAAHVDVSAFQPLPVLRWGVDDDQPAVEEK